MNELVVALAKARKIEAEYTTEILAIKTEIKALIEERYGALLGRKRAALSAAIEEVESADTSLRAAALLQYAVDGNKKPHEAVTVKVYTALDYDPEMAFNYCCEHLTVALEMNRAKFEKVAKVAELDFVTIKEEPRVTVARDLSKWLEKGE